MIINGKAAAAALVKARAAMKSTVTRDARANYGKYATLAAVMEAISPALTDNGLALVQEAELGDGAVTICTALVHESGEVIEFAPLTMPVTQRTPQAVGSAITYGRRYQLTAVFGLAPDDDDGAEASKTPQTPQERTNGRTTSNHTTQRKNAAQRPAARPTAHVDSAAEVNPDSADNLFETLVPTDAELAVIGTWAQPADAQAWAVEVGGCTNEFEARNSFKNLIENEFGGKLTKANIGPVYVAYYRKQLKKAQERQEAA